MKERERKISREQVTIRLPEELKEQIQREADRKGISLNAEVLILIQKGMGEGWSHVSLHKHQHMC